MKIAIHSDLHLEGNSLPNGFGSNASEIDLVVLAGDIGVRDLETNLRDIKEVYKDSDVLFIPGNHEFYGFDIYDREQQMLEICRSVDVQYLEVGRVFDKEGFRFIGNTGWSDTCSTNGFVHELENLKVEGAVSDFYRIRNDYEGRKFSVKDMINISQAQKFAIATEIWVAKESGLKPVVITHFPPLMEVGNPMFGINFLSRYFHNDWSDLISKQSPYMWIYGHTHYNSPLKMFHNTLLECNMRGYNKEDSNLSYNPSHVLEL